MKSLWKSLSIFLLVWTLLFACLQGQNQPQEPNLIDVGSYEIDLRVEPDRNFLSGQVRVEFEVLEEAMALTFDFNKQLSMISVKDEEGVRYSLRADDYSRERIRVQGDNPFRRGEIRTLVLEFEGVLEPEQYAFLDMPSEQKAVISRDGALLLSEGHWFPSHRLLTDAAQTEIRVEVPLGFSVVAPGSLQPLETLGVSEVFTWKSAAPLSRVPVIIDRYFRQRFEEDPFL